MPMKHVRLYSASEVEHHLRLQLGPIRSWSDTLADMRRGRTTVYGCVLLPTGRIRVGRAWRPAYAAKDVNEFVRQVRVKCPDAQRNVAPQHTTVFMDTDDRRGWKLRKLVKAAITHVMSGATTPGIRV